MSRQRQANLSRRFHRAAIRVRPVFVEGATAVRTGDEAQVVETSVALRVEWRRGASGAWSEGALDASGQLPSSVFTL